MGQKVNPVGMRVGINREWDSTWYADKEYAEFLQQDIKIRKLMEKELKDAMLSRTLIKRVKAGEVTVTVNVARPGLVLGNEGKRVAELSKQIVKICNGAKVDFKVAEVANPDLDAILVAKSIAQQLEERVSFRVAQKKTIKRVMAAGAKGIKTSVSGRLGGADIARSEGYSEGITPLHTLRSDIDFAIAEAATTYGKLGVKVWICRGEILKAKKNEEQAKGE